MRDFLHRVISRLERNGSAGGNGRQEQAGRSHERIRASRRYRGNRGEELVEFALVLPMFFLLMFAMIDLGRLYFIKETLENAIRQAGRYAITGAHRTDPVTSNLMSRVNSIIDVATHAAAGIDVTNIKISSIQGGTNVYGWAGGPGDTVTISLTTTVGFFTPGIAYYFRGTAGSNTFTESVSFRNERFPASQTL